jgi:hypothetical protein
MSVVTSFSIVGSKKAAAERAALAADDHRGPFLQHVGDGRAREVASCRDETL